MTQGLGLRKGGTLIPHLVFCHGRCPPSHPPAPLPHEMSAPTRTAFSRLPQQLRNLPLPLRPLSTAVLASASKPASGRLRHVPAALEVTSAAADQIRHLLSQRTPRAAGVRIGLRTRGCNGMAYTLNYTDEASAFDEKVEIEGAKVFIDPRALMHIVGTKMDFVDNDLVSEFVFHNPNAKGTCGCGESFNV